MALGFVPALIAHGLPMAGDGDGFHVPGVDEFFPEPIFFAGTPFALNRLMMIRLIAALFILIMCVLYAKRAKLVPGRWQATTEALFDFSRVQIGESILGEKAREYQPFIMSVFLGILFMNLTGVIPGLQLAGTAVIGLPMIFAIFVWVIMVWSGIRARGGLRFLKEQLFPPGVPKVLYPLVTLIEGLSTFILRPFTLTIRLLANMMSGHMILVVCFVGTNYLLLNMGGFWYAAGAVTLLGSLVMLCFEMFIACLQAYIFALLTAVYINLSISQH